MPAADQSRPPGSRAEGTRDRILNAAQAVLTTHGLARATTREIATAAGVAEGTLYRHFASREAIFLAVLLERVPGLVELITTLPARQGVVPVAATLTEVATAVLAFYRRMVPLASALFAETVLLDQWRAHLAAVGLGPQVPLAAVSEYLVREQAAGRVAAVIAPATISAMLFGACLQRAYFDALRGIAPDQDADARFVAELVTTLDRALAP